MIFSDPRIKMSEEEYRLIRDFVYSNSGISFDESAKFLLERRLYHRLEIHGLSNYKDYHRYLLYGPDKDMELNSVLDILTTNETYFYREQCQLKAFTDEVLPEIMERKKNIRIWSAGCSTGEEPYTIAMLVLDKIQRNSWDIEIFAHDISHRAIRAARHGIYSDSSFRTTEECYKNRFFEPCGDGKFKIKDEVKRLVKFGQLNLLDANRMGLLGKMDVVFCRNVIIYFDTQAKKNVIENLYNRLDEGSYLLLGHSESLINISTAFILQNLKNDIIYRKPFLSGSIDGADNIANNIKINRKVR